ncbi:UDP-glucose/GDP-mannose dehydrogenase family protein [Marinobacterium sp. AK62]|uniref:UDP-glucose 6-dehydrogenase n=1 Tax=Marinobacterium alkalitolerans TaxID=1542925 RepID=A0ABS3ZBC6_9GAMM|nr:UDP-glucose/GDP-mannose dehydrogenase family protein [Marinobacterium alkalitolerans]MBP0049000.1 UDP-glucose/GDP-mannose dehydrogenase family protein [Marinobacterium alkalitolerans]
MNIAIWGDELAAWVATAELARTGNRVMVQSKEPGASSLKAEPGLMDAIQQGFADGAIIQVDAEDAYAASVHWLAMHPAHQASALELCSRIGRTAQGDIMVINQSNFGIGASDRLQAALPEPDRQAVICLPDTLQQGQALAQFARPTALLLGCEHDGARLALQALLRPFSSNLQQLQWMTRREAEFSKFAISGMLAMRLNYINELANLADRLGVDIEVVRQGMATDPRIGQHYLAPGCGFGGSHFTQYIEGLADVLSQTRHSTLLKTVLEENERQKELPFRKLWQHYQCDLSGKTVTLWGCAFKPGVASIDNAPALAVIRALEAQGVQIQVHDPEALPALKEALPDCASLKMFDHRYQALEDSDALLIMTEWPEYASPDYDQLLSLMRSPVVIDGRNLLEPEYLREKGFVYYGVGR